MNRDSAALSARQRWLVRTSWKRLEPLVSKKGFGGLQSLKQDVGMPVASRYDHHDVITTSTEGAASKEEQAALWERAAASNNSNEESPLLTLTFYRHLFSTHPQMREIFWRFNLHQSMEKMVAVLADPDVDLQVSLRALAERHRGRGILPEDYDRIGGSLRYALTQVLEEAQGEGDEKEKKEKKENAEVEAWMAAWSVFAEPMKFVWEDEPKAVMEQDAQAQRIEETEKEAKEEEEKEPEWSMEEVARHNHEKDLWMVIDGSVYDVTKFFSLHPGTGEKLLLGAGKDASNLFINNSFHSPRARRILQHYRIGRLQTC
ncbi:Cytochrome b5 type B (outer mitochondrial membrane) [Balamuthia mandrillaris]